MLCSKFSGHISSSYLNIGTIRLNLLSFVQSIQSIFAVQKFEYKTIIRIWVVFRNQANILDGSTVGFTPDNASNTLDESFSWATCDNVSRHLNTSHP